MTFVFFALVAQALLILGFYRVTVVHRELCAYHHKCVSALIDLQRNHAEWWNSLSNEEVNILHERIFNATYPWPICVVMLSWSRYKDMIGDRLAMQWVTGRCEPRSLPSLSA